MFVRSIKLPVPNPLVDRTWLDHSLQLGDKGHCDGLIHQNFTCVHLPIPTFVLNGYVQRLAACNARVTTGYCKIKMGLALGNPVSSRDCSSRHYCHQLTGARPPSLWHSRKYQRW